MCFLRRLIIHFINSNTSNYCVALEQRLLNSSSTLPRKITLDFEDFIVVILWLNVMHIIIYAQTIILFHKTNQNYDEKQQWCTIVLKFWLSFNILYYIKQKATSPSFACNRMLGMQNSSQPHKFLISKLWHKFSTTNNSMVFWTLVLNRSLVQLPSWWCLQSNTGD